MIEGRLKMIILLIAIHAGGVHPSMKRKMENDHSMAFKRTEIYSRKKSYPVKGSFV